MEQYSKTKNANAQREFRNRHPYYNSYMQYCKRRRKKGLEIDITYNDWCLDKMQQKPVNRTQSPISKSVR